MESESDLEEENENVQTEDYHEFPAWVVGHPAWGNYERKVPQQYTQYRDDRLMNSLITNYATGVVVNGVESLFLKKADARAVYDEVKTSHGEK